MGPVPPESTPAFFERLAVSSRGVVASLAEVSDHKGEDSHEGRHMPQPLTKDSTQKTVAANHDNSATIALLEDWANADATIDSQAIEEAEKDLARFKASLNANRPDDRPIFP